MSSSQFGFESQVILDVDGDGAAEVVIGATNAGGDLSGAVYGLSESGRPGPGPPRTPMCGSFVGRSAPDWVTR